MSVFGMYETDTSVRSVNDSQLLPILLGLFVFVGRAEKTDLSKLLCARPCVVTNVSCGKIERDQAGSS